MSSVEHGEAIMPKRISKFLRALVLPLLGTCCAIVALAQEHHHEHGANTDKPISQPRVLLDKSPRIVWYQLNRLNNQRLLLVERATDDPKYKSVYTAILTRAGMSRQDREDALRGLFTLNQSDEIIELLTAIEKLETGNGEQQRVARQLAAMLLAQPPGNLANHRNLLAAATESEQPFPCTVGFAGLITAGDLKAASARAAVNDSARLDWLASIELVPDDARRATLLDSVISHLDDSHPVEVRRAAIAALSFIPKGQDKIFRLVASLVADETFRTTAIHTLLRIPREKRPADSAKRLVNTLVELAEATPAQERTTDAFIDAMQLADQLLAELSADDARSYRQRLRAITVRVVRIHTVQEEMRYDTPYFAVEAGRPVQVVLKNEDLMPHNFVITLPGALQEVAIAGAKLGLQPGFEGKPYIPDSDKVLFAIDMVQASQQRKLTFTAPKVPGEYPYVCTFPRHWMRMYGVMIVVDDLDAWLRNPTEPTDPIGNTRAFVQSWALDDFTHELETGLRGRSLEIGRRMFEEATCAQCHRVNGQGGAVGPELADVLKRFDGDRAAVLREILEPSHRIDPRYAVQLVMTSAGQVITGIVKSENKSSVSLITNPETPTPTVIAREDIDEIVKSSVSMMPKALLDRFSKDEIFELLAYVLSAKTPPVE